MVKLMRGTCGNCGREDEELSAVRRIYFDCEPVLKEWRGMTVVDEVEYWCLACCSTYPHQEVTES